MNVPDKNLVVSVTSLTFPPKSPLVVVTAQNQKIIQIVANFYTKDQPINIENKFTPNPSKPIIKKPYKKFTKTPKTSPSKPKQKFDLKTITCYKCGQKGHTSRFCKINTKLHELQLDEDIINQLQNLYIETSNTNPNHSNIFEEEFQIDELATSSSSSNTSANSKQISVLTRDQEFILETIKRLDDPQLQKNLSR
jgi:hypothetical protein